MNRSVFYLVLLSCFVGIFSVSSVAQDPAPPPSPQPAQPAPENPPAEDQANITACPRITLKGPTKPVREGAPVRLTASLAGGDKKIEPMFDWSVSAGMIRTGQGTSSVEIDTSGAGSAREINATLLIGGYAGECNASETVTFPVAGPAQMADEFGALSDADLNARLEAAAAALPPGDQLFVIGYAGRNNVRGYTSSTLRQIRTMALRSGLTTDRLVTIDGGFREEPTFQVWIVPSGAEAPVANPSINARDIIFPKASAVGPKGKKP